MLLGVFVVVIEAQKLEVCIQTELHGWKAKWNSVHKHEWWYCQCFHHNLWDPTENTQHSLWDYYIMKMLVRLNMHATLKKPLNLANKFINLEQKQVVSAGLLNLTCGII